MNEYEGSTRTYNVRSSVSVTRQSVWLLRLALGVCVWSRAGRSRVCSRSSGPVEVECGVAEVSLGLCDTAHWREWSYRTVL